MPATPSRRSGAPNTRTPGSQKRRLQGLWKDGTWWCNCEPRNKAVLREVTSNKPSKGKFFWKCDVYPYCDFFLWRDDAQLREVGVTSKPVDDAVQEPPPRPKTPTFTQRPLTSFFDTNATPSSKRKRDPFEDDDSSGDSDSFGHMDSDEERQLAVIADDSARKAAAESAVTPAHNRAVDPVSGIPTPSVARTLFPGVESSNKRQKVISFQEVPDAGIATPTTPATKPVEAAAPSSSPGGAGEDVEEDVMRLLRETKVDPDTLSAVQALLTKSARRTRGVSLGRESARAQLREKDVKIARLQERIAALENKDKMHQSQITNMKANLMRVYQDN